ncbi:putative transposase YbfD/YdcC [Arthrobacter stackebrandtii]|uniref:Transposase YbfD/YdcC n=1 Tax=Arthrobacter stackebrandtii TaxID=272161 RepID=A0ABS4YRU6_9MICC|nr:ISAs1 family transposase [Arthrobacter stackebrandtii]MBP2411521.1 putative transposase YbfD/YdcC [Arthrobacter stackebrandtii]PYH00207.1 ISAs1 family transposase [Arthrobacter stackebrandtii]
MPSSHLASFIDEFATVGPVEIDPGKVLIALSELKDPRRKRGVRHRFAHLLVIMVCSVLAGATSLVELAEWAADTARDQLAALGIGAPHATTLARVLQRLDADALDRLAGTWAQEMTGVAAIAIDGKEVRGAKNGGGARVHLLAGIDQATGAVLVQENVSEKHNEITYFKPLLEGIKDLKGVVISADALHTQREHADYLHSREAHFVFTVKANQPKLHDQLRSLPWNRVRAGNKTHESANGREIERTIKCVSLADGINFPHATQAAQITRKSRPLGTREWSTETVYIVTSLTPAQGKPELIGSLIRGHWGIENGLHWRRDVTWREDESQVRRGNAPRVMASLRNIAITILRLEGETNIAKATRGARNYPHRALKLAGLTTT